MLEGATSAGSSGTDQARLQGSGGISMACQVLSRFACWARLVWVYQRPSGPMYVPVAVSCKDPAIGGR